MTTITRTQPNRFGSTWNDEDTLDYRKGRFVCGGRKDANALAVVAYSLSVLRSHSGEIRLLNITPSAAMKITTAETNAIHALINAA
jgi:hypothetical protein